MSAAQGAPAKGIGGFARQSLIYGMGVVFNRLVAFVMLPVYTRYISPADYGVLQLLGLTMDIVALVAGARLAGGIFYFYHAAETEPERKRLLATSLTTLWVSYALLGLFVVAAATPLANLVFQDVSRAPLLRLAGIAFIFEAPILVGLTAMQVWERSLVYVGATAARLIIQVLLNLVVLIGFGWGIAGMMGVTAFANVLVGITLASMVVRETGWALSSAVVRRLVKYGLPLVGTQVATMVAAYGDRYVLQRVAGESVVGLYSVGYQFGVLVFTLGFGPLNQVWEPKRFAVAREPHRDAIYARAFVLCNLAILALGTAIVLGVADFLRLATPPAYHAAATVVPLIVGAYVLQSWTDFHNLGIMMRERTSWLTVANWLCAAVALGAYLVLVPRLGAIGAGLGLLLAYVLRFLVVYVTSQRLWPVHYRWGPVLKQLLLSAAVCAAALLPRNLPLGAAIAWHVTLFALYIAGLFLLGIVGPEDRELLKRMWKGVKARVIKMESREKAEKSRAATNTGGR